MNAEGYMIICEDTLLTFIEEKGGVDYDWITFQEDIASI